MHHESTPTLSPSQHPILLFIVLELVFYILPYIQLLWIVSID